jgi:hypothetical protein
MPLDEVNPSFVEMVAQTQSPEWFKYIFSSGCRYVEERKRLRITIDVDETVPRRSAIGVNSDDRQKYIILVNPLDVEENSELVRLRVAHELGHLCCGHEEECRELAALNHGDIGGVGRLYSQYRQRSENEAEVFALNMLYARGPAVEREIMTDDEFSHQVVGGVPLIAALGAEPGSEPLVSILNSRGFRDRMRLRLREQGYLLAPRPVLCKALREILPANRQASHRQLAEAIHHAYRGKLGQKTPSMRPCCDPPCDYNCTGICPE